MRDLSCYTTEHSDFYHLLTNYCNRHINMLTKSFEKHTVIRTKNKRSKINAVSLYYGIPKAEAIKKIKADIIYLDPPYTGTMNDYFSFYGLVDNYFTSKKNKRFKNSFIDKKESIKNFEKLFSRLKKFKYCFLSYNNQSYPTKEDLLKILKNNFKKVKLVEKKHNYQITGKNKKGTNTEFLFIIKNE